MMHLTSNQLGVVFLDSELTSADSYSGVWILGIGFNFFDEPNTANSSFNKVA